MNPRLFGAVQSSIRFTEHSLNSRRTPMVQMLSGVGRFKPTGQNLRLAADAILDAGRSIITSYRSRESEIIYRHSILPVASCA